MPQPDGKGKGRIRSRTRCRFGGMSIKGHGSDRGPQRLPRVPELQTDQQAPPWIGRRGQIAPGDGELVEPELAMGAAGDCHGSAPGEQFARSPQAGRGEYVRARLLP